MSVKLIGRVWDMRGLPQHYKMVLLRMADHANTAGWCYPGQASLSDDCATSVRSVERAIAALDRLGLVEKLRRHRRSSQEYIIHIPDEAQSEGIDWAVWVAKITEDPELRLGHAWFDQDLPQVAGQTSMVLTGAETGQDPTRARGLPGGLDPTQDPTQDPTPVAARPDTIGGSLKGTVRGTFEPRARSAENEALRSLALERAVLKGATNPEGLAKTILREDRTDLERELTERRTRSADIEARGRCSDCDQFGRCWYDMAGLPVPPDDAAAHTAVVCTHPSLTEAVAG